MKIERLSENQIRCTLYKSDLAEKELLLTELAYGTEKAKQLFRELMQQASEELGFEVDNIPLMIEAIPVSQDCLVLIITKVEDPDELDTRFSRFTRPLDTEEQYEDELEDDVDEEDSHAVPVSPSEGLLEALGSLAEGLSALGGVHLGKKPKPSAPKTVETPKELSKIYSFNNLDQVIVSARLVKNIYRSYNSLYKNPQDSRFYLYMKGENADGNFLKTCNIISEYGNTVKTTYATLSYIDEHFKMIIPANALQTLAEI